MKILLWGALGRGDNLEYPPNEKVYNLLYFLT